MARTSLSRPGGHSAFVIALLVGLLGLTALLAFQAASSARSHKRVAEKAVSEFARVAAWEFAGTARRTLFANLTNPGLDLVATSGAKHAEDRFLEWDDIYAWAADEAWVGRPHLQAVFSRKGLTATPAWRIRPGMEGDPGLAALMSWVEGTDLGSTPEYDPRWSQSVLLDRPLWGARVLAFRRYPEAAPTTAYGFVVHASALSEPLGTILEREPVLPASMLDRLQRGNGLAVEVRAPEGGVMAGGVDPAIVGYPYTASDTLGAAFGNLAITLAIPPAAADALVVGGLPASRLPTIIALLLLTIGTVIAAIALLRREGELSALRADFVSSVSHELRTPIAQIRMFGETLLLDRVRSDEERDRSLRILVKEATRLAHQVDNVLLFSRAERRDARLSLQPTDLAVLLEGVVEAFEPLAATRAMTVETDLEPGITVLIDALAIEQAVLNLLDNAVKYGPEGQTVRLVLERSGSDDVRVFVEDQGPGIPPSGRKDVWEPYARLDRDRESAVAGTGIGLAVVQHVVQAHGGVVAVEAGPNGGARLVMTLPVRPSVPI